MLVFSLFWFGCSLATNERAARLNNSNAMLYLITTNLEAITLTAKLLAMICLPITIAFLLEKSHPDRLDLPICRPRRSNHQRHSENSPRAIRDKFKLPDAGRLERLHNHF